MREVVADLMGHASAGSIAYVGDDCMILCLTEPSVLSRASSSPGDAGGSGWEGKEPLLVAESHDLEERGASTHAGDRQLEASFAMMWESIRDVTATMEQ